jgi:hypothetical protein
MAELTPFELERVVRLIEDISRDVDRLTKKFVDNITEVDRKVEDTTRKTEKHIDEIERRYEDYITFSIARLHLFGTETEKTLDRLEKKWAEYGREVERHLSKARGPLGNLGQASGLTSVFGAVRSLPGQFIGSMPFGLGGLLGMMLWGAKKEEEFEAAARRSLFAFQAIGGVGKQHVGPVTAQIRTLYQELGTMGDEVLASAGAFAEFGIGEQALAKAGIAAEGFMDNLVGISMAVNKLNAAAPETTEKLIGETLLSGATSARDAADQVFRLADALREAKLNYTIFGQGIVQATSALRIQNQSLDDTRRIFEGLRKHYQSQGVGDQRAAFLAMTGTQAVAQGLGGLQQGLQGELGRRLAERGVPEFANLKDDPFAMMVKMQEGLTQRGSFQSQVMKELQALSKEMIAPGLTGERARMNQIGALQGLGLDFNMAKAIVDIGEAALTPAEESAASLKGIETALKTAAETESVFEKDFRKITDELAKIASSILDVLVAGFFSSHIGVTEILPLKLKQILPGFSFSEEDEKELSRLVAEATLHANVQDTAIGRVNESMGRIAGLTKGSFQGLVSGEAVRVTQARRATQFEAFDVLEGWLGQLQVSGVPKEREREIRNRLMDIGRKAIAEARAGTQGPLSDSTARAKAERAMALEIERLEGTPSFNVGGRKVKIIMKLEDGGPAQRTTPGAGPPAGTIVVQ